MRRSLLDFQVQVLKLDDSLEFKQPLLEAFDKLLNTEYDIILIANINATVKFDKDKIMDYTPDEHNMIDELRTSLTSSDELTEYQELLLSYIVNNQLTKIREMKIIPEVETIQEILAQSIITTNGSTVELLDLFNLYLKEIGLDEYSI